MPAAREDALRHQAIRRLVELAADRDDLLVSVVDPSDGTILWCSERGLRRLVGCEPHEVIGKPTSTLAADRDWAQWTRTCAEAATGETVLTIREVERADGDLIRLASTAWRVDGDRGPVVALSVADRRAGWRDGRHGG